MGLRSGEFPGHGPKILMLCSSSHLVILQKVLHHAGKGIVYHQTVPGWLGEGARRMCWNHSLFMAVFLGKIVSEPTPLAEKQPC